MLAQIAALTSIDLGAGIIKGMVFDKRTELRRPIVVRAGNNLPRQVRVTSPSASVDRDSTGYWIHTLDPGRCGIVNADPGAGIRLESLVSRCKSQDEVPHERARIDPSGHVALCQHVAKGIPQGEVSATP